MIKYLVKEISTATAENPNFAGQTSIYYFGKGERILAKEGTHGTDYNFNHIDWMINEYGYSRLCDAKRAYAYKNPENSKFWTSTVEIVEIEIA